jgi:hypothetical protein
MPDGVDAWKGNADVRWLAARPMANEAAVTSDGN